MAWQASWSGTVRSTAREARLRACPAPKTALASSIATFDGPSRRVPLDDLRGGRGGVGGDRGQVVPGGGAVADQHDLDGTGAEDPLGDLLRGQWTSR